MNWILDRTKDTMNQTIHPDNTSDKPWPIRGTDVQVPDTSMLPGSEGGAPAAVGMLKHAVQGAHDTIDRLADKAEPAVRQLGVNAAAAAEAVKLKTHQLRDTRDEWAEDTRAAVRRHPLASIAAAFALGALLARVLRTTR